MDCEMANSKTLKSVSRRLLRHWSRETEDSSHLAIRGILRYHGDKFASMDFPVGNHMYIKSCQIDRPRMCAAELTQARLVYARVPLLLVTFTIHHQSLVVFSVKT